MRSDSTNLIGSLVGIAIANVAATRPGGGPPEPRDQDMQNQTKGEQHSRERQAAYLAYLETIGHADEARWTETEFAAGWQVRAVWQKGLHRSIIGAPVLNLAAWWAWGLLVLGNLFYVLVLGALAGLLARTYWARSGSPLPVAIRRGTAIGVGGAALVGLGMAQPLADDPELATAVSFASVLLLAAGSCCSGWHCSGSGEPAVPANAVGACAPALRPRSPHSWLPCLQARSSALWRVARTHFCRS